MNNKLQRTPQGLFSFMRRHPYLLTILLCGILLPFGYADRAKINTGSCIYLGIIAAVASIAAIFGFNLGKSLVEKLILCGIAPVSVTAVMLIIGFVPQKTLAIALIALTVAVIAAFLMKRAGALSDTSIIMLLILLGIAIRFVYALYTGSGDRQHDVGAWGGTAGHLGYIEYWNTHSFRLPDKSFLPDFDLTSYTYWQYYHPPFHHWLMAGLLSILSALGVPHSTAAEATQILPMLYSSLTMIVSYRIFRLVKLKGMPLIAAMAIMCFHPTFILFGGSFNNDMLLMLMVMSSIMWGLRWYRDPRVGNIVPLALCIGLGMMTKLSGWMVAPAVAMFFLIVLIKNIRKPLRYIGQYALFAVICAPLGLWWQVRNLILFKLPLTYVPMLDKSMSMYSGNMSLAQRLLSFGNGQLSYVYGSIKLIGAPFDEYNPTIGLFKTAMFDEGTNSISSLHYPQISVTGPILFWLSVILFTVSFVCFIVMMIKKNSAVNGAERAYFALIFATHLISYYMFAIAYPFSCTFNIRYCMPLIPLCAMGLALALQRLKESKKPAAIWFGRVMYALTAAFCAMSYLVYTQVGITA